MIQTQPLDIHGQGLYSSYDYECPMVDFSKPLELDLTSERNVESPLVKGAKKLYTCLNCNKKFIDWIYRKRLYCSYNCWKQHHIPYNKGKHNKLNKKNNHPNNLISLCLPCHSKTDKNRDYWSKYYTNKVKKWEF